MVDKTIEAKEKQEIAADLETLEMEKVEYEAERKSKNSRKTFLEHLREKGYAVDIVEEDGQEKMYFDYLKAYMNIINNASYLDFYDVTEEEFNRKCREVKDLYLEEEYEM